MKERRGKIAAVHEVFGYLRELCVCECVRVCVCVSVCVFVRGGGGRVVCESSR